LGQDVPCGAAGSDLLVDCEQPNLRGALLIAGDFARRAAETFRSPLTRPEYGAADALRGFTFDAGKLSRAYSDSGITLLGMLPEHSAPGDINAFAEQDFRKAIAFCPDDLNAWLGLGIARLARAALLAGDKPLLARIAAAGAGGRRFYARPEEVPGWLENFARYKIDGAIAATVSRLSNGGSEACRERVTSAAAFGPTGI
jgi:hypothetical protein